MRFQHSPGKHVVTRIAGPSHNYLAVSFAGTTDPLRFPEVSALPPIGAHSHFRLNPDQIVEAVQRGVDAANQELQTKYRVRSIEYVENDSGPEITYESMAKALIIDLYRRIASSAMHPNDR